MRAQEERKKEQVKKEEASKCKECGRGNKQTKLAEESSSEESRAAIPFEEASDSDSSDEESDPDVSHRGVGDFIIVKSASKCRSHRHIGPLESTGDT